MSLRPPLTAEGADGRARAGTLGRSRTREMIIICNSTWSSVGWTP